MMIPAEMLDGLKTYSIALVIILTFCYLAVVQGNLDALKELALPAVTFIFGLKIGKAI